MKADKSLTAGSTALMLMKLLSEQDMYGYQMIVTLRERSDHTFDLKAGTLYPLLHSMEQKGWIESWEDSTDTARPRRYYRLTSQGRGQLAEKEKEFRAYTKAVCAVLDGGLCCG